MMNNAQMLKALADEFNKTPDIAIANEFLQKIQSFAFEMAKNGYYGFQINEMGECSAATTVNHSVTSHRVMLFNFPEGRFGGKCNLTALGNKTVKLFKEYGCQVQVFRLSAYIDVRWGVGED